jgi:hypothetical protein
MAVKNSKIGAILSSIGSTITMIIGLVTISMARTAYLPDPSIPAFVPYIPGFVTLFVSVTSLTGSVLAFRGFRWGYIFVLAAGFGGLVCTFLPIYVYDTGYGLYMIYLATSYLYADLILMIVGGILGFALVDKRE